MSPWRLCLDHGALESYSASWARLLGTWPHLCKAVPFEEVTMTTAFGAELAVFQTAADPNGSHGLNLSAPSFNLRDISVTAPQQTIYIWAE